MKWVGRPLSSVLGAELADGAVEQRAHELLVEERLGLGLRRELGGDLALGAFEIERHGAGAAAAFEAGRGLPHVHHETIGAHAHERAELRLRRLVLLEPRLLERVREERLREILRVLGLEAPGDPEVLVHRLPVALDQIAERLPARLRIDVTHPLDHGVPRRGKSARRTRVAGIHGLDCAWSEP